jgi:hypothetical protein
MSGPGDDVERHRSIVRGRILIRSSLGANSARSRASDAAYERKLYLLPETPDDRRYAATYLDVYQFPDGKLEIRAARENVPYSTYDKLGAIDQGAIVENKRLCHALRISSLVHAERDRLYYASPSTAHRVSGKHVPINR